jgi:hypothetical protein
MHEPHGLPLEGAWQLREYITQGTASPVAGLLLLADGYWTTVFFVGADSHTPWGSGEGGEYRREGDALTFTHRFTVQARQGDAPVLLPHNDRVEPCRITLTAETLAIDFPSGNTLRLVRGSRS